MCWGEEILLVWKARVCGYRIRFMWFALHDASTHKLTWKVIRLSTTSKWTYNSNLEPRHNLQIRWHNISIKIISRTKGMYVCNPNHKVQLRWSILGHRWTGRLCSRIRFTNRLWIEQEIDVFGGGISHIKQPT